MAALLADEPGIGKTLQAILAALNINAKTILVICPAVARPMWARAFFRFVEPEILAGITVVIRSYEATLEVRELQFLMGGKWDALILDEAHFLKGHDAKRTENIFGVKGLCRVSKHTWALTGTPISKDYGDAWLLLYVFGATKLKYQEFIKYFCITAASKWHKGLDIKGSNEDRAGELRALLDKIMLRRGRADVNLNIPGINMWDVPVPGGYVDLEIHDTFASYCFPVNRRPELAKKLTEELDFIEKVAFKANDHTALLSLLEACSGSISTIRRHVGLQKIDAVVEIIEDELARGSYKKIVLFAIHRDVIKTLGDRLRHLGAVTLYGGTDKDTKQKNIDKFQTNPKCKIFIGQIRACGTAIDLTAASEAAFIEWDFIPDNNNQAIYRLNRMGAGAFTNVRFFSLYNSYDERLTQIIKVRTRAVDKIFRSQVLTELNPSGKDLPTDFDIFS